MPDFDIFQNRWTIKAKLELETPMRIGGGQNAAAYSISAAPVLQTFNAKIQMYEPYIPGSSLKGVLRTAVERLIRTFDESKSCISVVQPGSREKSLCGDCISCGIFGSMKAGAKIRVRDSHILEDNASFFGIVKEQPHCATKYDRDLNVISRKKFIGNKSIDVADTFLRLEEIVTSGVGFNIQIDVDNANEKEIGVLLLALDEFNKKRLHLGGGSSRGNGFAHINNISIVKKSINENFKISESVFDSTILFKEGRRFLKSIDSGNDTERRDFDIYYKAHSKERNPEGHIVAMMKVTTVKDFKMAGAEEETVTSGGEIPVIPGSTIKGFLRHELIKKGVETAIIKEIFGFTDRDSRRGRLLVSDAYSDTLTESGMIPADSILKMWLIFDNMTADEVGLISDLITKSKNVITGRTTSNWNDKTGEHEKNVVNMEFDPANIHIFRTSDYLAEVS
jgi:CRISPR/Cas system CSM-associated protein Csm3 (group 7 of RAMP superfamily)